MARVTQARLRDAYLLGHEHGREGGGRPPDYVATDGDLLDAYDEGRTDGEAAADRGDTRPPSYTGRRSHRSAPTSSSPPKTASTATPPSSSTPAPTPAPSPKRTPAPRSAPGRRPAPQRTSTSSPSFLSIEPGDVGMVVFGGIVWALASAYLKGGWSGVGKWLSAKFLNTPGTPAAPATNPGTANQVVPRPGGPVVTVPPSLVPQPAPAGGTYGSPGTGIGGVNTPGLGGGVFG